MRTARQRVGDVDHDSPGSIAETHERPGHDLVDTDIGVRELQRARLQPTHGEEVADELVQAIDLFVDRLVQLMDRLVVEFQVVGEECRRGRLDRREGRAQVVRHRPQQRGPERVGFRERDRARRLGPELAARERDCELGDERVQHAPVVAGEVRAVVREHRLVGQLGRGRCITRAVQHRFAGVGFDLPLVGSDRSQHGNRPQPEGAEQLLHDPGQRIVLREQRARHPHQRRGFAPRPGRFQRAPGRDRHERAHDRGDDEEHDQLEHVLAVADRPRMDRWREIPVDE